MSDDAFFRRWHQRKLAKQHKEKTGSILPLINTDPPHSNVGEIDVPDNNFIEPPCLAVSDASSPLNDTRLPKDHTPESHQLTDPQVDETGETGIDPSVDEDIPAHLRHIPPDQLSLAHVATLSPDDSIAAFLVNGVSQEVKRAALDQLFQHPIFNVRDGLNDYDQDFTLARDLPESALAGLRPLGGQDNRHSPALEESKSDDEKADELDETQVVTSNSEKELDKKDVVRGEEALKEQEIEMDNLSHSDGQIVSLHSTGKIEDGS